MQTLNSNDIAALHGELDGYKCVLATPPAHYGSSLFLVAENDSGQHCTILQSITASERILDISYSRVLGDALRQLGRTLYRYTPRHDEQVTALLTTLKTELNEVNNNA